MRWNLLADATTAATRLYNSKTISSTSLNVLVAALLTALYNDSLWLNLIDIVGVKSASSVYFYLTFYILASTICFSFLNVVALFPGHKYSLILIVIAAATGSYFIDH